MQDFIREPRGGGFESLFHHASIGIVITGSDGEIVSVNPHALRLFQYEMPELAGKNINALIPERFHAAHLQHHQQYLANPVTTSMCRGREVLAIKKDRTEFAAEIQLAHFKHKGNPITAAFITDISDRKNAEDRLVEKEQHMRLFIAHTAAAIAMFDEEMRYMMVSNRWLKDYNLEGRDLTGISQYDLFPDISPQWKDLYKRGLAGEELHCEEDFFYRSDGAINWIRWELYPWFRSDQSVGGIIIFTEDITERKQGQLKLLQLNQELEQRVAEKTATLNETLQKLEASEKALKKHAEYQDLLFNNIAAIIISIDADGIIKTMNKQAEKELGYTQAELAGKFTPLIFHDPDSVQQAAEKKAKQTGRKVVPDFHIFLDQLKAGKSYEEERMFMRKNGTRFPVRVSANALLDEQNRFIGGVAVARNIEDQKKQEKQLLESLSHERELNELKSRFITMASHEFRTPLSTVLSSAYLIEKYTAQEDQHKRQKHLQRIVTSVNMLSDILNDFLSVGKIEEGRIQVRPAWFSIREEISSLAAQLKNNLKKNQKILYQHSGADQVYLDPSMLRHIVMNLVSNASKFSPEGRAIDIRTVCEKNTVTLSVKDKGIGIPKEDQKHLMERFFRAGNVTNIQGTGLGLHIVAKYAELMNGTVQCISELEKGTEFIITFTHNNVLHEKNTAD